MTEERAPRGRVEPSSTDTSWQAHPNENPVKYGYTKERLPAGYTAFSDATGHVLRDLRLLGHGSITKEQLRMSVGRCRTILDRLVSDKDEEVADNPASTPEEGGH